MGGKTGSRFAVDPKWIIYLPPTMSPSETTKLPGLLEHPQEAFSYYRHEGVPHVICEQKHMGSRAVVVICREESVAVSRFGVIEPALGVVYTRTGRPFFPDRMLEREFLVRVRDAVTASGLWDELHTDWLCLDCELMPWSMKAQELLRVQYAPVGTAGIHALEAAVVLLSQCQMAPGGMSQLLAHTEQRREALLKYRDEYRRYCWPVASLDDLPSTSWHPRGRYTRINLTPGTWRCLPASAPETHGFFCRHPTGLLT